MRWLVSVVRRVASCYRHAESIRFCRWPASEISSALELSITSRAAGDRACCTVAVVATVIAAVVRARKNKVIKIGARCEALCAVVLSFVVTAAIVPQVTARLFFVG